jgi:hypothetical protein
MAKKPGFRPLILGSSTPGDDVVIGTGSGQSTTDPYPCTFADWQTMFENDNNYDEQITIDDYGIWWANQGFSLEMWNYYNPGTPWNPVWGTIS